jgi:hypothetical protein
VLIDPMSFKIIFACSSAATAVVGAAATDVEAAAAVVGPAVEVVGAAAPVVGAAATGVEAAVEVVGAATTDVETAAAAVGLAVVVEAAAAVVGAAIVVLGVTVVIDALLVKKTELETVAPSVTIMREQPAAAQNTSNNKPQASPLVNRTQQPHQKAIFQHT